MADIIHSNYYLIPVIHRFGFRLGFGNKSVDALCKEFQIDTDFFISIVNTFQSNDYFPQKKLLSFSPLLIIDYLKKTHQYYIAYSLPRIEKLLKEIQVIPGQNSQMKMIEEFYTEYRTKLLNHIDDEEQRIFPYIELLVKRPGEIEDKNFKINFEEEHKEVDFEIYDLKNLIIKYLSSEYNEHICNELLIEIFRFENDILNHARIEDAVLIPMVTELQKKL